MAGNDPVSVRMLEDQVVHLPKSQLSPRMGFPTHPLAFNLRLEIVWMWVTSGATYRLWFLCSTLFPP